jgi:stringent starvation protein B
MTPLKPYLIRSIYEWIVENDCTPHLLIDATNKHAVLPVQFIEDGKIVLNVRPAAVDSLSLDNDEISFNARFGGRPMHIIAPVKAVLAIYAKENGKGMVFDAELGDEGDDDDASPPDKTPPTKPSLRVVK